MPSELSAGVLQETQAAINLAAASGHSLADIVATLQHFALSKAKLRVVEAAKTWRWTNTPQAGQRLCDAVDALHVTEEATRA